jgi:hypothetical protein
MYVKMKRRMEKLREKDGVKVRVYGGRPRKLKLQPEKLSPGAYSEIDKTGNDKPVHFTMLSNILNLFFS